MIITSAGVARVISCCLMQRLLRAARGLGLGKQTTSWLGLDLELSICMNRPPLRWALVLIAPTFFHQWTAAVLVAAVPVFLSPTEAVLVSGSPLTGQSVSRADDNC